MTGCVCDSCLFLLLLGPNNAPTSILIVFWKTFLVYFHKQYILSVVTIVCFYCPGPNNAPTSILIVFWKTFHELYILSVTIVCFYCPSPNKQCVNINYYRFLLLPHIRAVLICYLIFACLKTLCNCNDSGSYCLCEECLNIHRGRKKTGMNHVVVADL